MASSNAASKGTQALARAAALLREIANTQHLGTRLADLATRLELERPTAHRILRGLVEEGLVQQEPRTRCYQLGPLVYELGLAAAPPSRLLELADAALDRLAEDSGDVVFLIAPRGRDAVCLDRRVGSYPVKALMMDPGRRRPMGVGAGSTALLAGMPEAESAAILAANTRRLAASKERVTQLTQCVAAARAEGYSLREAIEAPGIASIAVAVVDNYGKAICAFSISSLRHRIEDRQDVLLSMLRRESRRLSAALGNPPRATPPATKRAR